LGEGELVVTITLCCAGMLEFRTTKKKA